MPRPARLGAGGRTERPVKLLFGSGSDFVKFRMQPADFRIQFDKRQTLRGNEFFRRHSSVGLSTARSHADTRGGLLGSRVAIQIHQIEA